MMQANSWARPRSVVLGTVALGLHALFVLALLGQRHPPVGQEIVSTFILVVPLRAAVPQESLPSRRSPTPDRPLTPVPPSLSLPAPSFALPQPVAPITNWNDAARRAAVRSVQRNDQAVPTLPIESSPFWPLPSEHHQGEAFAIGGQPAVWVSDTCYQLSRLSVSGAPEHMVLPMTICPGKSGEPRGDLFLHMQRDLGHAAPVP